MLKKTLVMGLAAAGLMVDVPAFAGGNTGIANEVKIPICLSNFNLIGVSIPVGNTVACPTVS